MAGKQKVIIAEFKTDEFVVIRVSENGDLTGGLTPLNSFDSLPVDPLLCYRLSGSAEEVEDYINAAREYEVVGTIPSGDGRIGQIIK